MPIDSNIGAVGEWLDSVIDEIGWEMPAGPEGSTNGGGTLAEAAMDTIVDGIQARSLVKVGADAEGEDETEWDDNSATYQARKKRLYGEHNPNFRTTQMLSRESLRGEASVSHEAVEWRYGTGKPSPAAETEHDRTITDREKARLAEDGQSKAEIRRPFFAITVKDADDVLVVVESAIDAHLQRKAQNP